MLKKLKKILIEDPLKLITFSFLILSSTLYIFETTETINLSELTKYNEQEVIITGLFDTGFNQSFVVLTKDFNWLNRTFLNVPKQEANNIEMIQKMGYTVEKKTSFMDHFKYRPLRIFWPITIMLFFLIAIKKITYEQKKNETLTAKTQKPEKISFDKIGGIDEVKDQIIEVVNLFKNSSKIKAMGGRVPKGVILSGPAGTGKTLMAKALASECGANFIPVSASSFVEMYVGVGASRIRTLFQQARDMAPCVIFIDEIDAVGGERGRDQNSEREQTLNQLLVEMDGFSDSSKILVMAATNQLEKLDKALIRPGRFDRNIRVFLPNHKGRLDILNIFLSKTKYNPNINKEYIASMTSGMSGADIENLVNEAIILASKEDREEILENDIINSFNKILMGEKRPIITSPEELKRTAYHEIGHAFMAAHLNIAPVNQVSITPRGMALGVTQLNMPDVYSYSLEDFKHQIIMALGGRVAEKMFFNHMSTGAMNDLQRAFVIARSLVVSYGLSSLGPISLQNQQDYALLSEDMKKSIDKEIIAIIAECEEKCYKIMEENKKIIIEISEELFKKENLTREELNKFYSKF